MVSNSKKLRFVSSTRGDFDFSRLDEIYSKLEMKIENILMTVYIDIMFEVR
jgi:hypothetical protein